MNQLMLRTLKKTPLDPLCSWIVRKRRQRAVRARQAKELVEWESNGKPVPPPHIVKQRTLRAYSERYSLRILVETGTYDGDMVEAMKDAFDRIYSIELSEALYQKAKERFKRAKHIELICGDSGIVLKNVMRKLDQPALFWLDGHYSAGVTAKGDKNTPICEELRQILGSPERNHVIVIDDARCFGSDPDYPSIQELYDYVKSKRPNMDIEVKDDSIRVTPTR